MPEYSVRIAFTGKDYFKIRNIPDDGHFYSSLSGLFRDVAKILDEEAEKGNRPTQITFSTHYDYGFSV